MSKVFKQEALRILRTFEGAYIRGTEYSYGLELVLDEEVNAYFSLEKCDTKKDFIINIVTHFPFICCKAKKFTDPAKNKKWWNKNIRNFRKYIGKNFSSKDINLIYKTLGEVRSDETKELTEKFIENDFKLDILRGKDND